MKLMIALLILGSLIASRPSMGQDRNWLVKGDQYLWIVDGKTWPELGHQELLNSSSSIDYMLGLVECIHLKGYLELMKKVWSDPEVLRKAKIRGDNLLRIKSRIAKITTMNLDADDRMPNARAVLELTGGRLDAGGEFLVNGMMRFASNSDYGWRNVSDLAVLKQESAIQRVELCRAKEDLYKRFLTGS